MREDPMSKKPKQKKVDMIKETHDVVLQPGASGEGSHPEFRLPGMDGLELLHIVTKAYEVEMVRQEDGTFKTKYRNRESGHEVTT